MKAIGTFIKIQEQIRIYHWETLKYAEHKALGKAYEELGELIDSFVEVYIGKYGLSEANITYSVSIGTYEKENVIPAFREFVQALTYDLPQSLGLDQEKDSDLLNIRDEMLQVLNQTLYLLRLS